MKDIFSKYTERYCVESSGGKIYSNQYKEKFKDDSIIYSNEDIYNDKVYNMTYKIFGEVGYMCPNCHNLQHIKTKINNNAKLMFDRLTDDEIHEIESNHVKLDVDYSLTMKCPICKYYKKQIRVDDGIADAISILNIKGYVTSSSSEGYTCSEGGIDPYIGFNTLSMYYKGKTLSKVENFIENTLPLSWYIDRPSYMCSYVTVDERTRLNIEVKRSIPIYMINYFTIKSDYWNKEEALYDILKWARSLPDLKEGGII